MLVSRLTTVAAVFALVSVGGCHDPANKAAAQTMENKVIIFEKDGKQISAEDLEGATGTYDWSISSSKTISPKAIELHNAGRELGATGNSEAAIATMKEAHALEPDWAYPLYDIAYTYLLNGKNAQALEYYEKVDRVEPRGFFTSKTALWSLRKEQAGHFQEGLYQAYLQLEWLPSDQDRMNLARQIVTKFPDYAPAWKEIGILSENSKDKTDAFDRVLNMDADMDTKGSVLINKAIGFGNQGARDKSVDILGSVILDPDTTLGNLEVAKFVLANFIKE